MPLTRFPCDGLPEIGSVKDSMAVFNLLGEIEMDVWFSTILYFTSGYCLCLGVICIAAATISSSRNHDITSQRGTQTVPPSSGGIVETICRSFQTRSNVCWISSLRWKLTYHIPCDVVRLSLKECSFQIHKDKSQYGLLPVDTSFGNLVL